MSALSIPTIPKAIGNLWVKGETLASMLKAISRAMGEAQEGFRRPDAQRYDFVQLDATGGFLKLSAFDGRRLATVKAHEVQICAPFLCYVPGALVLDIAKLIDGEVFNIDLMPAGKVPQLVIRDDSGTFKLWADPIAFPQKKLPTYEEVLEDAWSERQKKSAQRKVDACRHRTELLIKDLTRFGGPMAQMSHLGERVYHSETATLHVYE